MHMNICICELLSLIHFKRYMNSIGFNYYSIYFFIIVFFYIYFSLLHSWILLFFSKQRFPCIGKVLNPTIVNNRYR